MEWLLSNEDFDESCADKDWMYEVMTENGIVCESVASIDFIYSSTDYDVPDCPSCGANDNKHYVLKNKNWQCKKCRKKFSITTGRYLDNTKLPLTHWWRFCFLVVRNKRFNSCAIARDLGVTQKTAWVMIDTLKRSMKDNFVKMDNNNVPFKNDWEVKKLLMKVEIKQAA